jgi:predicted transcriptional regulator
MRQRSVGIDDELEKEIQEIATKNRQSFTVVGYTLLKAAMNERKRQAEKSKNKKKNGQEEGIR